MKISKKIFDVIRYRAPELWGFILLVENVESASSEILDICSDERYINIRLRLCVDEWWGQQVDTIEGFVFVFGNHILYSYLDQLYIMNADLSSNSIHITLECE